MAKRESANKRILNIVLAVLLVVTTITASIFTVEAAALTIKEQPKSVAVANGQTAKVTVKASGDDLTYQWYIKSATGKTFTKSSATTATYAPIMSASVHGRQAYCVVTDTYGNTATTDTVTLFMTGAVAITKQPQSVVVANGEVAKVKVTATGKGLSYQWYIKSATGKTFEKSSVTKAYYSPMMSDKVHGRQAYCVIKDTYGNMAVTDIVTLAMDGKLAITEQPRSVAAAAGDAAKVAVVASGKGLTYQWYIKSATGKTFTKSSVTKEYYAPKMSATVHGRQAYCVIKDSTGKTVTSNTVTLTMKDAVVITMQPKSVFVEEGEMARVAVAATGKDLSYQWYIKSAVGKDFSKSSIMNATYKTKMTEKVRGRQVYCVIKDTYGNVAITDTVTLGIDDMATITKQPQSVSVANGEAAKVTVVAKGKNVTYQWYIKSATGKTFTKSSVTKEYYAPKMSSAVHGRQAYCVVTDAYGNAVISDTVTLSMTGAVVITKQPQSVIAKDGEAAKVTVTASGTGLTYQWYIKSATGKTFTKSSATTATYAPKMSATVHGRQAYCVIKDTYGNTITSDIVTLAMDGMLAITEQPQSVVVKDGETAKVTVKASGTGLTYQWYIKSATGVAFAKSSATTATYAPKMSATVHGRQAYCVIKDSSGKTVTTDTVTLKMEGAVLITQQPKSAVAPEGASAKVTVSASGDGLTYTWYYKDKGASDFVITRTFTSADYTVTMNASRDDRQVYCVVTDKYGNSVQTNTVTLHMGSPVIITMQPESVEVAKGENLVVMVGAAGEGLTYKWYYKDVGASKFTATDTFSGGVYTAKMSDARDGRQIYCVITDATGTTVTTKTVTLSMKPAYQITVDLGYGEPSVVKVKKDGKYSLSEPTRVGYSFKGWKTLAGKDFAASGTVDKDVSVKAVWSVVGTKTLSDLVKRTKNGASEILITGNITINQPIYISYDTTIYTNGNYTLKRDPNYAGDMFVVGKDANGVTSLLHHRKAVLTLGGGSGTLTIDGNRDNVKVNVVGSLVFAGDSSTVNIKNGAVLCNNKKLGNERLLTYTASTSEDALSRGGGAAIVNNNSVVNMYGGSIYNNAVKTEHTVVTDAQGVENKKETAGCGGAIYNNGAFNMYGGSIYNNEALRGGAVYTMKPTTIEAGTIQSNRSYTYGGAVSSNASSYANVYLGSEGIGSTLLIKDNYSKSAGGAVYSNTTSPIVVLGNTVFEGNHSDYSGGAIYTGGSLTVRDTTFRGNSSIYSAGAIFFHNTKDSTWQPREAEITGCVFEENEASLGGAIVFSRSNKNDPKATGVVATITDCTFHKNEAVKNDANPGNGGAIYVTQLADATITGCDFTENVAASGGGAVSVNGEANAKLKDLTFTGNSAVNGGALYLSVNTVSKLNNLAFDGNKAVLSTSGSGGNGGAIYAVSADTTVEKLDIRNNDAATNGGAVYLNATTLTLGADSKIEDNSAGDHGGAFYLTYTKNGDGTKTGSHLVAKKTEINGNSAKTGGAISIRTDCEATLTGAKLAENSASAVADDAMGGGAVYVGYGKLTLTDTTMSKNASAYYGGAVYSRDSEVTITGGSVSESTGGTGAALYFCEKSAVELKNLTVKDNVARYNGVLYVNNGTLNMTNVTASGNKASSGGVLYTSGASTIVTLKDSTWSGNNATKGGALCVADATVTATNCQFKENTAKTGGVLHAMSGNGVSIIDSTLSKNSATSNGGAIYLPTEAAVTLKNLALTENHADGNGGAIYNADAEMTLEKLDLQGNSAGGNGGAIYLSARELTVDSSYTFKNNSAGGHGGAIYLTYKTNADKTRTGAVLNATNVVFEGNTAMAGGAVSARSACAVNLDGTVLTGNSVTGFQDDGDETTTNDNDGDSEGGGAIYVGYGTLTLKNVTATGNTASDFGGVVSAVSSPVTITGGEFSENTADNGGVIHAMTGSTITANGTKFLSNASLNANTGYDTNMGGGVFHTEGGTLHITASTLDGNKSGYYGGIVHSYKTEVTIDGKTEISNTTGGTGAALYMRNATAVLEDISVTNNTATMNGVIYYSGSGLTVDLVAATGNKAYQGGVLFPSGASTVATVKDCSWSGNSATNGGAIYSKGATVNLENITMSENTASYGGAVYTLENGKLNLTGTTFLKNSAKKDGGAIYDKTSVVTVADTDTAVNAFRENTAGNHGGAIYVVYTTSETDNTQSGGTLNVTGGSFTGNTAIGGGAVSLRTACQASFDGTVFTENKVTGNDGTVDGYGEGGGAIYAGYGAVTIKDITATGNTSENYGGTVHLLDSDAVITGSTFNENAAADGGAIYAKAGGNLTATGNTFTGNTATANGGAVYVAASVTAELKELAFKNNHADGNGGALGVSKANLTTDKLDLQNNSATGNGGAVYLQAVQMTIDADDVFTGNTAEGHGGAFYLTYSGNDGASLIGTNAVLENNTAKAGGAISSRSYCNVELTDSTLKNNKATSTQAEGLGGGAIYSNTNTLTLSGVTLENNTSAYYGGAIYTSEAQVVMDNKSVVKGNGAITGVALYFKTSGNVKLNDVAITDNLYTKGSSNGVIYVTGSVALDVDNITATGNKTVNGGVFYTSGSVSGKIQNSTFTGNTATSNGGVIDYRSSGTLNVTGNTFSGNTTKTGGAIYCEKGTVYVTNCQITENTATNGGAIGVAGTGKVSVTAGNTLSKNTASTGGAVYVDGAGTAELTGITLENYTATSGGAIAAVGTDEDDQTSATLILKDVTLKNNNASYGGAVYLAGDSNATVTGGTMTLNTARLGGAIYNMESELTLADALFTENSATKSSSGSNGNGGAIVINGGNVTGTATFEKNTAENHAGAVYLTYVRGENGAANIPGVANLTDCSFTENTAMGGGAVSIRTDCSGTFENATFTDNSVSGHDDDGNETTEDNNGDGEGGGAIYVGYGSVTLNNVTATGNTATDSFGGFLDSLKSTVTITGGSFTENVAPVGGAIYGLSKSTITITDAEINENQSTYVNPDSANNYDSKKGGGAIATIGGTLTISGTTLDSNISTYYGGALLISGTTVNISDSTTISNAVGKTGSAVYIRDSAKVTMEDSSILDNKDAGTGVVYISSGTLDLNNVTATGNTGTSGGVVAANGSGATVNVTGGTYSGNSASYGGVIYMKESKVNVNGATMTENSAYLGGAIYNTDATLTLTGSTFTKNTATKDSNGGNGNGGVITVVGGTVTGTGTNTFTENSAEGHGGAIYVSYVSETDGTKSGGTLNMTDGVFEKNTAYAGGAISSRTNGTVTLNGTKFTGNSSTAPQADGYGGGAIYTNDGTLNMSGVTMEGNTTAYYGGAVYAIGSVFNATNDCVVKENVGITGTALWLSINKDEAATITDMTLQGNQRKTGNSNGTIYATGSGALNMTNLTATGNVSSNGGVLYTSGSLTVTLADSTITDNEALTTGGVVAYRGTKTMTISGCTISDNTAPTGGAIEASGAGVVTIEDSTLKNNTATKEGGAIYTTGSGKVIISDDSLLKANSAKNGGAIALDLGGTVTVDGSTLDGNSSTSDGGAIYVADTGKETAAATKLVMTDSVLKNNSSGARGGALATDGSSTALVIDVTDCTFTKNTSTTSGGAVAVQCGNCNSTTDPTVVPIVFTDCIFQENVATTDGGALDVRTGSCLKIDGITAEGNTAKGNAGVVYVTSNNTRLYITGTVTYADNTAKNGLFSYLYNNNYTNPPKIYTTHANTEPWYADLAGNRANVAFNLTTLP